MNEIREIVTRAVIAKGKKLIRIKECIAPSNETFSVLGCWVINHSFSGSIINNNIEVNGSYDVNIWYSYDNDTKTAVATKAQAKWKTARKIYTEDGVYANIKPYMGVNEFLEGLTNSDDKLFFPEFVENNYWTKRFLDWAEGKYTEDEQELFGFTSDVKPKFDVHPDLLTFKGEDLNEVSTEEQKKLRAKMEEKEAFDFMNYKILLALLLHLRSALLRHGDADILTNLQAIGKFGV